MTTTSHTPPQRKRTFAQKRNFKSTAPDSLCYLRDYIEGKNGVRKYSVNFGVFFGQAARLLEDYDELVSVQSNLIAALERSWVKLNAYVGVCKDDKELPKIIALADSAIRRAREGR